MFWCTHLFGVKTVSVHKVSEVAWDLDPFPETFFSYLTATPDGRPLSVIISFPAIAKKHVPPRDVANENKRVFHASNGNVSEEFCDILFGFVFVERCSDAVILMFDNDVVDQVMYRLSTCAVANEITTSGLKKLSS